MNVSIYLFNFPAAPNKKHDLDVKTFLIIDIASFSTFYCWQKWLNFNIPKFLNLQMGEFKNNYSNFLVGNFSITQKFYKIWTFQIPIHINFLIFHSRRTFCIFDFRIYTFWFIEF